MLSRSASAAASAGCPTYWPPATPWATATKNVKKPPGEDLENQKIYFRFK